MTHAIVALLYRLLDALWLDTEAQADEDKKKSIYREDKVDTSRADL